MNKLPWMTLILMGGLQVTAASPLSGGEHAMTGAEVAVCRPDGQLCLRIESEKTVGSKMQSLHRLTKAKVSIEDRKKKTTKTLHPVSAYIDFENNQIVWIEDQGGNKYLEVAYHLKTLHRTETKQ